MSLRTANDTDIRNSMRNKAINYDKVQKEKAEREKAEKEKAEKDKTEKEKGGKQQQKESEICINGKMDLSLPYIFKAIDSKYLYILSIMNEN